MRAVSVITLFPLISQEESGNRIELCINYQSRSVIPALYAVEYDRYAALPQRVRLAISEFLADLKEKPILAVLFGSFARRDHHADSDIDILLIYDDPKEKMIENSARKISQRTDAKIAPVYIDYLTFKKQFHDQSSNFFKNMREDRLILAGIEWWRELINEEA
ncbi:MAG: nucleotidyltransferase domain-containing protein [Nanoarchaeota archaeon]